jgi:hypothetical protein
MRIALCLVAIGVITIGSREPGSPNSSASPASAAAPPAVAGIVTHGLRVTMVPPVARSWPRSALLRVRVEVTNVSKRELWLARECDRTNPRAVVTNGQGVVVYTAIRTWPVAQPCVRQSSTRLVPGRSVSRENYVVLRGPVLLPVVEVLDGARSVRVVGKPYRLTVDAHYLTPRVTAIFADGSRSPVPGGRGGVPLFKTRRILALEVSARAPTMGPLVAIGSALCPHRRVLLPVWTVISRDKLGARIGAPCPRPRLWLVDFGWAGESVGQVLVGTGNLLPSA